jgi:nicotinamide mononucleotide (NMN) deamidase PncC
MKSPQEAVGDLAGFAGVVARAAMRRGCTIAAAESVSAGSVAVGLGAAAISRNLSVPDGGHRHG